MSDFVSCSEALEGHFDKQLAKLPAALRKRVQADCPMPWDTMSPEQRRNMASQWDYQHDSSVGEKLQSLLNSYDVTEPVQLTGKDVDKHMAGLLQEITKVMNNAAIPDDIKNLQLADLRSQHHALGEQLARGDYPEPNGKDAGRLSTKSRGHLNHDLEWQKMANEIASQKMTESGRPITKNAVAKFLAEKIGETVDTTLRRIRKGWK